MLTKPRIDADELSLSKLRSDTLELMLTQSGNDTEEPSHIDPSTDRQEPMRAKLLSWLEANGEAADTTVSCTSSCTDSRSRVEILLAMEATLSSHGMAAELLS